MTYAAKISKAESRLDWQQTAAELERRIRAFDPFPGATSEIDGTVIKIWRARLVAASGMPGTVLEATSQQLVVACGSGALSLEVLQRPGSKTAWLWPTSWIPAQQGAGTAPIQTRSERIEFSWLGTI